MFRASLHNHSLYSDKGYNRACRHATPTRIVREALKHDLDGIGVTDTNSDLFFRDLLEYRNRLFRGRYEAEILEGDNVALVTDAEDGKQTYVYNGIEFHDDVEGHIVVVGHKGSLTGKWEQLNLEERIALGKEAKGIVFAPHPLAALGIGEEKVREDANLLDAVEKFNAQIRTGNCGSYLNMLWEVFFDYEKYNKQAEKLAKDKELGIPAISSADSNSNQPHLGYIVLPTEPCQIERESGVKHVDYLRRNIRNKRFYTHEQYISILRFFYDYIFEFILFQKIRKLVGDRAEDHLWLQKK